MATFTPRVINLTRREGQSFGFLLRVELGEEGHLIRSPDRGGLAEMAGIKDADRVLRVNGIFVDDVEHALVAGMVRNSGSSVTLHVLDQHAYKRAKDSGINLSEPYPPRPTMNGAARSDPIPKLCFLEKAKNGFGFSLKSMQGEEGVFIVNVTQSGVAEKAGAKSCDRILEVNGENVENATHNQVVEKIQIAGTRIMFLLVDEDTDRHRNRKIKLGVALATTRHLPTQPRIVNITKGSDGYGFYLRSYPNQKGHFIKDIDRGSPAERVGLKEMDRLVAVDGDGVEGLNHEETVDRIRRSGNGCSLLVVDAETDDMYKLGGASPLLYWEEMRRSVPQQTPPESPKTTAKPTAALPANGHIPTPVPSKPSGADYKSKLCTLQMTSSGFGFHLNGIVGVIGLYFIKEVVKGGAADKAGLEDDDILIEVNGVNVEARSYDEAVAMIRDSGSTLVLLLAEKQAYDYFKAQRPTLLLPQASFDTPHSPTSLKEVKEEEEDDAEKDKEESDEEKSDKDEERDEEEKRDKEEEKDEEEKRDREEEKRGEEERKEPATLPVLTEARERAASSSSSSPSIDEQF